MTTDGAPPHVVERLTQLRRQDRLRFEAIGEDSVRLRLVADEDDLRVGDVMKGPSLMLLVDVAAWGATLTQLPPHTDSFTVDLHIHFLRKSPLSDLVAEARVLRAGRTTVVTAVSVWSLALPGREVAHATVTTQPTAAAAYVRRTG